MEVRSIALGSCGAAALVWAVLGAHTATAAGYSLSLAAAVAFGYWAKDLDHGWRLLCLAATIWLVFCQWFWPLNTTLLGCGLALLLAAAITYSIWWFIPVGLLGLVASGSRGGILALALGILVTSRAKAFAAVFVIAVCIVGMYSIGRTDSINHRLGIWRDTLLHLTPLGNGFGSFAEAYADWPIKTNAIGLQWAPAAYNDYLQLLFELGLGAIPLFVALALIYDGDGPHLPATVFLLLSLTYFPLYIPGLAHIALVAVGHATRRARCQHAGDLRPRTI